VINLSKELSRSIDYLETRSDLDKNNVGYFGFSWGACMGAILPAVEKRVKASVLHGGGFYLHNSRPEADQINFAPRVTTPVLMLNGRYDFFYPVETSQVPMFRLLGTPKEHKRHVIFEAGHVIPRNDAIRETLSWFDRYFGPVKRKEQ
jgi:dienelactone hydrolase